MASWAKPEVRTTHEAQVPARPASRCRDPECRTRLAQSRTPEGWVKKVDRAREGRVWVGYFHIWEHDRTASVCAAKRRRLSAPPQSRSTKHSRARRIYRRAHGQAGETRRVDFHVRQLWKAFCAVKSGQWSKKTKENLECLFAKHVMPTIGSQRMRDVHLTSLQLLVNNLARDG